MFTLLGTASLRHYWLAFLCGLCEMLFLSRSLTFLKSNLLKSIKEDQMNSPEKAFQSAACTHININTSIFNMNFYGSHNACQKGLNRTSSELLSASASPTIKNTVNSSLSDAFITESTHDQSALKSLEN